MIKKILKSRIFYFCLGIVIAGSIGVYAVAVASSEVTYDNTTSGSSATTVKDAIDDLYTLANHFNTTNIDLGAYSDIGISTCSTNEMIATKDGLCAYRNGHAACFKTNDYNNQKVRINQFFQDIGSSCDETSIGMQCGGYTQGFVCFLYTPAKASEYGYWMSCYFTGLPGNPSCIVYTNGTTLCD